MEWIYGIHFRAIHKKMLREYRLRENVSIGSGCRSAILNLIKLNFFTEYPYLKLHILFYSNGLAIWSGFPDITHIKKNNGRFVGHRDLVSVRILPNFKLIRVISEMDIWYKFCSETIT